MQQAGGEHEVRSRQRLQIKVGRFRGPGSAWVDYDQRTPVFPLVREPLHRGRHGFREVAADKDDQAGLREIGERKGQSTVHAERTLRRSGRRTHAEPPVVINCLGPQRDAGELPECVALLVREAAATEDAHRVTPEFSSRCADEPGGGREGLVERGGFKQPPGLSADERLGQPVAVQQARRGPAFAAQAAAVGGEIPAADLDAAGSCHQVHAALQ